MTSPFTFIPFSLAKIPMLAIAGVRIREMSKERSVVSAPFKHVNKNPFKSMYFAVQAMAAELSTAGAAMLALEAFGDKFAYIVVGLKAEFVKKADQKVFFECTNYDDFHNALEKAITTNEPVQVSAVTVGKMANGTVVSTFEVTWSFKKRER
jgi:hypothetical protein